MAFSSNRDMNTHEKLLIFGPEALAIFSQKSNILE
jgi:hypothetical protein